MDNQGSSESGVPEPTLPRAAKPGGSNVKWYAIIVVLLVVIGAMAVVAFYHPVSTGSTVTINTASAVTTLNTPYNLSLQTNGKWTSMDIYWGDGSVQAVPYSGSYDLELSHTYTSPGNYYIYYVVNFNGKIVDNAQSLIPVKGNLGTVAAQQSVGLLTANGMSPITNTSYAYKTGTNLSYVVGYFTPPSNGDFQVISQIINVYQNGSLIDTITVPYTWNQADGMYELASSDAFFNMSKVTQGYYEIGVQTVTGALLTQSIPTDLFHTTTIGYTAGQSTFYNSSANVSLLGGTSTPFSLYSLGYLAGTSVSTSKNTNVSFMSGSSVSYPSGSELAYGPKTSVTFYNGANLTFAGPSNFTVAQNTTFYNVSNGYTAVKLNNTTTYYANGTGLQYNFTGTTTLTFVTAADVTLNAASTLNYTATASDQLVADYVTGFTSKYLVNTTLMYANENTTVTYPDQTNVTAVFDVTGPTSSIQTGALDTTQGTFSTHYYQDVAIFDNAGQFTSAGTGQTYLNSELETGAYKTLDPAIEYDTVSNEIMMNTMGTLDVYQGSDNSSFAPFEAAYLPNETNGGINTVWNNTTRTTPWGVQYQENLAPGQIYTFTINKNATFQDGKQMTAWDVYYSMIRVLLFVAGTPGTSGWIVAQTLLPGDFYSSNTFYNITNNITVNNASNSITFNLQSVQAPAFVFQTIGYDVYIGEANWYLAHGSTSAPALSWQGGANTLGWNASGFAAYEAQGNQGSYNQYYINHVIASGPYEVSYIVPASQVVLVKNPDFVSPNKWIPAPTISTVVIQYVGQPSTNYLLLSSGEAQSAGLPVSSWGQVQGLIQKGIVADYALPTLSIFWYNLNANINQSMLSGVVPNANMPYNMFTNLYARKTFAYAYNYSDAAKKQFGNPDYPNTPFATPYAGMLPAGMAYAQSISDLNTTGVSTGQVPYFDLAVAHQDWNIAVNQSGSSSLKNVGVSYASSGWQYNGKALNIPIFIFSADPASAANAQAWAGFLQQVIQGIQVSIQPTSFPTLIGYMVQGQNPMGVYELGWAPDYPYPTDYLGPMAFPDNSSTYPGPNSMAPYWIGGAGGNNSLGNATEAHNLNLMRQYYVTAATTPDPTIAEQNFHLMNEMLINMTFYVYAFQQYLHFIINTKITSSSITANEMNIMVMGQGALKYNALQYGT